MTANVLHYPGERTNFDPDQVYGPDLFGGHYKAVSAEYDAARDRTTIAFQPIVVERGGHR